MGIFNEQHSWWTQKRILLVALFILALWPRLLALGRYITPDELIWVYRSVLFRQALLSGQWLETLTAEHPGVLTTWLGAIGQSLQLFLQPFSSAAYASLQKVAYFAPENMAAFSWLAQFLTVGRVLVAVVNSAGIVLIFWLLKPLFSFQVALLTAVLLAVEPFLAGLSGLFHVDGLMTTFATISLLALAAAWQNPTRQRRSLLLTAVSGTAAALAVLAKIPAVLIPFIVGLFMLTFAWQRPESWRRRWRILWQHGGVWLGSYGLVLLTFLPALWVSPLAVASQITGEGSRHVESVLRPSFFLGSVDFEQPPVFYLVVLALRLSPFVFSGIILAFTLIIQHGRERRPLTLNPTIGLLLIWTVLFLVAISLAVKKFDRYVVPIFPALVILGTVGWRRWVQAGKRWRHTLFVGMLGLQFIYVLFFSPYLLSAYNPLVGGPWLAAKALPLGWGEGISAGGRWLADNVATPEDTAVAAIAPSLAPFFPGKTLFWDDDEARRQADYLIVTAGNRQSSPDAVATWTEGSELLHTISYGGLPQAWIYRQPGATDSAIGLTLLENRVSFANRVVLQAVDATTNGNEIDVRTQWGLLPRGENGRYTVRLALKDAQNLLWASREMALLNETYFYPQDWAAGEMPQIEYALPLPPGLPPGEYAVALSLFDAETGQQLPILAGDGAFSGVEFVLSQITVALSETPPPVSALAGSEYVTTAWSAAGLSLLGYGPLPETAVNGGRLVVDLYWQARSELPPGLQLEWLLDGAPWVTTPLSRLPSQRWRPGELIHEKYSLSIPVDMEEGPLSLGVTLVDEDEDVVSEPVPLPALNITHLSRQFSLPADVTPLPEYSFGADMRLAAYSLPTSVVAAGESVSLTLYWEVASPPPLLYTAFVHVVGNDGQNLTQSDQWPGGLPSDLWVTDQIITDVHTIPVPAETPPGVYPLAVGLYTAADGLRLPVRDADGRPAPDNRVLLPQPLTVTAADE